MTGYDRDGYGNYVWGCPYCNFKTVKKTPQGRGMARSNHLRSHGLWTRNGKIIWSDDNPDYKHDWQKKDWVSIHE